ncbi:MAG: hypothetical protein RLY31_2997 [Bacteroidota bacterium]
MSSVWEKTDEVGQIQKKARNKQLVMVWTRWKYQARLGAATEIAIIVAYGTSPPECRRLSHQIPAILKKKFPAAVGQLHSCQE